MEDESEALNALAAEFVTQQKKCSAPANEKVSKINKLTIQACTALSFMDDLLPAQAKHRLRECDIPNPREDNMPEFRQRYSDTFLSKIYAGHQTIDSISRFLKLDQIKKTGLWTHFNSSAQHRNQYHGNADIVVPFSAKRARIVYVLHTLNTSLQPGIPRIYIPTRTGNPIQCMTLDDLVKELTP